MTYKHFQKTMEWINNQVQIQVQKSLDDPHVFWKVLLIIGLICYIDISLIKYT